MMSTRGAKDQKNIRVIKAGGDVLEDYFDGFVDIVRQSSVPTIILASPYGNLIGEARKAIVDKTTSDFLVIFQDELGISSHSSKRVKGLWEQLSSSLESLSRKGDDKTEAKMISAICKLSALDLLDNLIRVGIKNVRYAPTEYLIRTNSSYLNAEIMDIATMEALNDFVHKLNPGDVVIVPAYIGVNTAGEATYLGDANSEIIASKVAYLIKDVTDKRVRLNILAPAWYNLHPKWAEKYAHSHLEYVPFLTVEEVLTTADFMLSAIVEATVRGVITEIIDVRTSQITRIVKSRSNTDQMPIVAIAGYECELIEVRRSVYLPYEAEINIDNFIAQLSPSEIVHRASYPTSITRCLMHKDISPTEAKEDVHSISQYFRNVFRTEVSTCECTMIKIIGQGLAPYKDDLRRVIKRNLEKAGFSIRRYMDDDYYSITIILNGNGMNGDKGSIAVISKTALNLIHSKQGH